MTKLKLHFYFGWHTTKGDALEIRKEVTKFKPNIYVMENSVLPSPESGKNNELGLSHREILYALNILVMQTAKGDDTARETLMQIAYSDSGRMGEFSKELFSLIIDNHLNLFFLETHGKGEELAHITKEGEGAGAQAFSSLYKMELQSALAFYRKFLFYGPKNYLPREENIKANLASLKENLKIFGGLNQMEEVRLFVGYGLIHTVIFDEALKLGMNATISHNPDEEPTENNIVRELMKNPDAKFDDEILLRALIERVFISTFLAAATAMFRNGLVSEEPRSGKGCGIAKEYMKDKSTDDLLKLFEENANITFGEPAINLGLKLLSEGVFTY